MYGGADFEVAYDDLADWLAVQTEAIKTGEAELVASDTNALRDAARTRCMAIPPPFRSTTGRNAGDKRGRFTR